MYDSFVVDLFHYSKLNPSRFMIITIVMKLKLMLIY